MKPNSAKRICLWSGPRNISTALMYSFGNRKDTAIVDEPFYGFYLKNSDAKNYHPSAQETMESMECDGEKVIENLLAFNEKPIYFIKNMTHHLLDLKLDFLNQMEHLILTREPEAMIKSFSKVIEHPKAKDLGFEDHIRLIEHFKKNNIPYHVIDSKEILDKPEKRLKEICDAVGIEFSEAMLKWPKGARKEDGIWAKHWYHNVHQSTSFKKPENKDQGKVKDDLIPLLKESEELYQRILKK